MLRAWVDGKYDGVRVGQCEWHDHVKPDGTLIKLQGSWELAYARHLDEQEIEYEVHHGRIPYTDDEGVARSYYPDFKLLETNEYIDVKNPLYVEKHARKIELVRQQNDIKLTVLGKKELHSLGVMVK